MQPPSTRPGGGPMAAPCRPDSGPPCRPPRPPFSAVARHAGPVLLRMCIMPRAPGTGGGGGGAPPCPCSAACTRLPSRATPLAPAPCAGASPPCRCAGRGAHARRTSPPPPDPRGYHRPGLLRPLALVLGLPCVTTGRFDAWCMPPMRRARPLGAGWPAATPAGARGARAGRIPAVAPAARHKSKPPGLPLPRGSGNCRLGACRRPGIRARAPLGYPRASGGGSADRPFPPPLPLSTARLVNKNRPFASKS